MREGGSKKLNGRLPFVLTSYQLQLGTLCVFYPNVYFLFHIIGMIKRDILLPVLRIHGTILRIQGSSSCGCFILHPFTQPRLGKMDDRLQSILADRPVRKRSNVNEYTWDALKSRTKAFLLVKKGQFLFYPICQLVAFDTLSSY